MKHKNILLNRIIIILVIFTGFIFSQNSFVELDSLMQKANAFQKTSKWDSARFYYYKSIFYQHNNNFENIAEAHKSIGNGFIRLGMLDSAKSHLDVSELIYSLHLLNKKRGMIRVINSLAEIDWLDIIPFEYTI